MLVSRYQNQPFCKTKPISKKEGFFMLKKLNLFWISSLAVLVLFSTYHMIYLVSRAMGTSPLNFWEGMWLILCFIPMTLFYLFPYPCLLAYFLWKRHSFSIPQRIGACLLYLGVSLLLFHLPFAWELFDALRTRSFWWETYFCLLIGILLSFVLFCLAMLIPWFHPQATPSLEKEGTVKSLRYVFLYFLTVALGLSLLYLDRSQDRQLLWMIFLLPAGLLSLYLAASLLGWAWEKKRPKGWQDYLKAIPLVFLLSMLVFGLGVFYFPYLAFPLPQTAWTVAVIRQTLLQYLGLDLFFSLWFTLLFLAGGLATKLVRWVLRGGVPAEESFSR